MVLHSEWKGLKQKQQEHENEDIDTFMFSCVNIAQTLIAVA